MLEFTPIFVRPAGRILQKPNPTVGWSVLGLLCLVLGSRGFAQSNVPPVVTIVSPIDGAVSATTNALIIDVEASDSDGSITEVGLYRDGLLIGISDTAPYEFELINLAEGTNVYTASATDNQGAVTFSAPVHITELSEPPSFYAPYIWLSSPASNAVVIAPTNLVLVPLVTDRGYPVKSVSFAANNVDLATVTDPPFTWTVTNIALGSYTFTATVTDAGGYVASSPPVPVTVIPNPATTPTISLVSPTNGSSVPVGQDFAVSAQVTPHGNTIQKVDFYLANNLIGTVTTAPYTLLWRPAVLGTACLSAIATYGQGQTASSVQACVNVILAPGSYPQYVVVDLGPLRSSLSSALGLNQAGHFVGDWPTNGGSDRAFLDVGGIITVFNTPPLIPGYASGVNDSDQVLINANLHGYIYQQGSVMDVGSLGGGATFVRAINAAGQVVGDSQLANGNSHAFLYNGQTVVDLAASSPGYTSQANAINDLGTVVGLAQNPLGQYAFIYDSQTGMRKIRDPNGGSMSEAWGINNLGNAVGDSYYANTGTRRAFLSVAGVTTDLGTLGDQLGNSFAYGINNSNQVVGYSQESANQWGFLWMTNVLYDLNRLIPSNSNWSITYAAAINDAGQIIGKGRYGTTDRAEHAVLLNPMPGPGLSNSLPVVTMVSPTNTAVVPSGTDVSLAASVVQREGFVTNVAFYAENQRLGSVGNPPPFALTWSNVPAGTYQLTAVATDNLGATQTSVPISLVVKSPYPGAPRIAILSAAPPADNADIKTKLIGTLLFSGVDVISLTTSDPVPSLAQLLQYDALLVYDNQALNDPVTLGDLLAAYEDAGHGLVLALYCGDTLKYPLGGRLVAQNYLPWAQTGDNFASSISLVRLLPDHPILAGVQNLLGGQITYYEQNVSASPGTALVADWSNGQHLVGARQVGSGRLVGLNFFPVSSDVYSGWWSSATDGAKLIGNALAWAAASAPETAGLNTASNLLNYLPGQDISLTVGLTNFMAAPAQVDIYTNNALLVSLTSAPFSFTWPKPAVGTYVTSAVITDAQTNTITTRPLLLSVDSRLNISLLWPTNGAVIFYPTNVLLQVAASDLDSPILSVDYYIDGSQWIGRSTNAPFSFNWNVGVVGSFPLNAIATDAVGARHSSESNLISVIHYDPNKPVQTSWIGGAGLWLVSSNWSAGVPRPQDTALVDSGTASVSSGLAVATNLTVGLSSTGAVLQTTGELSLGQSLTLGQNAGSSGSFELDGPGQLAEGQLLIGPAGLGHFVQKGGTNRIQGYLLMLGDTGGQGSYDLLGGQLIANTESISSFQTAQFHQSGGTNTVQGLVVGGDQRSLDGTYYLDDGALNVGTESLSSASPHFGVLAQSGGLHLVSQALNVGVEYQGKLVFSGGTLRTTQLLFGTGGWLDFTAGNQTNGIEVSDLVQLTGILVLHLAPGYSPHPGDTWPLLNYARLQGAFTRVTLPPATNGVAWELSYLTNQLVLTATKLPNLVVVSPLSPTSQSNLFYQMVQITNPGADPLSGARIFIPGLPAGVEVYNAAGTVGGVPFVEYNSTIPAGQTVQFYVQLFSAGSSNVIQPNLVFELNPTNSSTTLPEGFLTIQAPSQLANSGVLLQFDSAANQTYYIQYSTDLNTWKTVSLPIIGGGAQVQWLDDGPPKTETAPGAQARRFYRIITP